VSTLLRWRASAGFIQGFGWVTNEELRYDSVGQLLSAGPTAYKIPNVTDLPRVLNVNFIDNPKHQKNVCRSKAVGEPPLMLGLAVWLAAWHALSFVNQHKRVDLAIPATGEELLTRLTELSPDNDGASAASVGGHGVSQIPAPRQ
jgi:xanthine dehydrogenase large subunit